MLARARRELKLWFAIDTLEFLRRGGRIGAASAWIGSTLKVKPILTVESEMTPVERVRTAGRAFERMVARPAAPRARRRRWCVQHIQRAGEAARLVGARPRDLRRASPRSVERDRPGARPCTPVPGCSASAGLPPEFFPCR